MKIHQKITFVVLKKCFRLLKNSCRLKRCSYNSLLRRVGEEDGGKRTKQRIAQGTGYEITCRNS